MCSETAAQPAKDSVREKVATVAIRYADGSGRLVKMDQYSSGFQRIADVAYNSDTVKAFGSKKSMPDLVAALVQPRSGIAGSEVPVAPALGKDPNPFSSPIPEFVQKGRGAAYLHPRVLNDMTLAKEDRDIIVQQFNGEARTYPAVSLHGQVKRTLKRGKSGAYYLEDRIVVHTLYWVDKGGKEVGLSFNVKVRDLQQATGFNGNKSRKQYRVWKDAQLKEAKNLTKKRIMKALAADTGEAGFKFGDRLVPSRLGYPSTIETTFIGYLNGGRSGIFMENGKAVQGSLSLYKKA